MVVVADPSAESRPTETRRSGLDIFAGVAVFLLLVAFSTTMSEGFWTPRVAVFLVVTAVGLPRLPLLLRRTNLSRPAALAALGFLGWAALATVFSDNRAVAVVGRFGQGTGLVFVAGLVWAWALGASLSPAGRRLVEQAALAGALINAAMGVLQRFVDLSSLHLATFERRSDGLLGNPVHLGAICAGALAFVAVRLPRRWLPWSAAAALLAAAIQLSGSRSGLLAAAGILVWAFVRNWRSGAILALAVVTGLAAGTLVAGGHEGTTAAGRSSGEGAVAPSGDPRLDTWRTAIHATGERPILGVGPGRFDAATSPRRTAQIARAQGPETIFTDGHNLFAEYAVTTGVPGMLALLAFLGLTVWRARGAGLAFALAVLGVGLLEPQFVGTTGVALLVLGTAMPLGVPAPGASVPRWLRPVTVGALVVASAAALALLFGDYQLHEAELDFSLPEARSANRWLRPWPDAAQQLAKVYLLRAKNPGADVSAENAAAIRWREKAVQRNTADSRLWNELGELQLAVGGPADAEAAFRKALARDPVSPRALNGIGRARIAQGDRGGAIPYLERSLSIAPRQPSIRQLIKASTPQP